MVVGDNTEELVTLFVGMSVPMEEDAWVERKFDCFELETAKGFFPGLNFFKKVGVLVVKSLKVNEDGAFPNIGLPKIGPLSSLTRRICKVSQPTNIPGDTFGEILLVSTIGGVGIFISEITALSVDPTEVTGLDKALLYSAVGSVEVLEIR